MLRRSMVLLFAGAGVLQVLGLAPIRKAYARWGYEEWFRIAIGLVEIEAALLLACESTKQLGVSQLAPIRLGSIYTHAKARGKFALSMIPALTLAGLANISICSCLSLLVSGLGCAGVG